MKTNTLENDPTSSLHGPWLQYLQGDILYHSIPGLPKITKVADKILDTSTGDRIIWAIMGHPREIPLVRLQWSSEFDPVKLPETVLGLPDAEEQGWMYEDLAHDGVARDSSALDPRVASKVAFLYRGSDLEIVQNTNMVVAAKPHSIDVMYALGARGVFPLVRALSVMTINPDYAGTMKDFLGREDPSIIMPDRILSAPAA